MEDLTQLTDEELDAQRAAIHTEIARRAEFQQLPHQYQQLKAQVEQVAQRYAHIGGDPANLTAQPTP